jgi:alpha-glucosidase
MNTDYNHWTAGVHHDGSALYVSNPLPALNETVTVTLRVPKEAPIRRAFLRTAPDGENHMEAMTVSHEDGLCRFYAAPLPVRMPLNRYRFKLITDDGAYYVTELGVSRADSPDFFDFALLADFQAPAWVRSAVFYQIFPDRFHNGDPSNDVKDGEWSIDGGSTRHRVWGESPLEWKTGRALDFYGGDLAGIEQKLDYLADLGVNALYLTPIFKALTNHRYDIMDFDQVDPHLGGDAALASLRRALDARGMYLMLDVTLNHIGWRHPWFTEAQQNEHAPSADFFTFYERPNKYEMWLGVKSLVKLNYRSEKLRERMYRAEDSVLRRWMRDPYRIDAWRLDVANMQGRQGVIQLGHKVGREIRRAVKGDNRQLYLIGEHFYDASLHLQGEELDATMNYQGFTVPIWRWLAGKDLGVAWGRDSGDTVLLSAEFVAEQWRRYLAAVPWAIAAQQFNLLGSHDTPRILTHADGDQALARLGATLLLTFPGVASIYYGDEIGMEGGVDPDNRRTMIWEQDKWNHDLRGHYQRLIALRRDSPALREGGFQIVYAHDGILAYQRQSREQRLLIIAHRGPGELLEAIIPVRHAGIDNGTTFVDRLSGATFTVQDGTLMLRNIAHGAGFVLEAQ